MKESRLICLGYYLTNALNKHSKVIENFKNKKFICVWEGELKETVFPPEFTFLNIYIQVLSRQVWDSTRPAHLLYDLKKYISYTM